MMEHSSCRHRRDNPSFSETLLDAIYRSISQEEGEKQAFFYNQTMKMNDNKTSYVEKKLKDKVVVRRKSMADIDYKDDDHSTVFNSSSSCYSSSDSSSRSSSRYCMQKPKPKPVRTSLSGHETCQNSHYHHVKHVQPHQKQKRENSFVKTKSKALKIYGDLKKVKQPISPGGRLASFLNSLFTAGNAKKAKISSNSKSFDDSSCEMKSRSGYESTCSSASSFSRSCLSKTTTTNSSSSRNGPKRSVRFEDSCMPRSLYEEQDKFVMSASINQRVEETARDLLKKYQKKANQDFEHEDDGNDDDDAASYASSDLFELENLSAIGIDQRFREELPVYGTTHLDSTNLAISKGLIM